MAGIAEGEDVKSLDLTNLEGPLREARIHILENIAAADDMPAIMLNNETFAHGFGEGSEDAARVANYIEIKRAWMQPLYEFFDMVTQRRAWNEDFYKIIQSKYPETYARMPYEEAFYRWVNGFTAIWPSLIREPESEAVRVEETQFKSAVAIAQVMIPEFGPQNKAAVLQWMVDTVNSCKKLFPVSLTVDPDELLETAEEQAEQRRLSPPGAGGEGDGELKEPPPAPPFSGRDSSEDDEDMRGRILKMERFLQRVPVSLTGGRK